jgi:hypothetical protein
LIFRLFKKKQKKKREPTKPNLPPLNVPLDQTTSLWRVEGDKTRL